MTTQPLTSCVAIFTGLTIAARTKDRRLDS